MIARAATCRRERRILALEAHLRAQYGVAITCVAALAVTGLSQKFDSWWIAREVLAAGGGIEAVRLAHRVAGGMLIVVGFYHLALVITATVVLGEAGLLRMIPTPADAAAALRTWLSFLGLDKGRAAARRAQYLQQLDYWFWGWSMGLMAVTGVINLVPFRAERVLSADLVLAALRTHSDASIIVAGWVLVVHIAYSGLAPSLFRSVEPAPAPADPDLVEQRLASPQPATPESTAARVHGHLGTTAASEDWETAQ